MESNGIRSNKLDLCKKCGKMFLKTTDTNVCPKCTQQQYLPEFTAQTTQSESPRIQFIKKEESIKKIVDNAPNMYRLEIQSRGDISTRSRIIGKKPERVPVVKIRPTNGMNYELREIRFSPILLIIADDGYYYIADGNHRFFAWLFSRKGSFIPAWILKEGDQKRLYGRPLPTYVREWKYGRIDLKKLCILAKEAYKGIEDEVNEDLMLCRGASIDEGVAPPVEQAEERDVRILALTFAQSILNLIQDKISLKEAASALNISEEELGTLHKCFIDGGIEAIRERLNIKLKPK